MGLKARLMWMVEEFPPWLLFVILMGLVLVHAVALVLFKDVV